MRVAALASFAASAVEAQWASMGGMDVVMCGSWTEKLDEMNRVCCAEEPGGECPSGFPSTCTQECAGIFGNFNDVCPSPLALRLPLNHETMRR